MFSKTRAVKNMAEADDDFPPALPFQLPGNEGAPDNVVLLGISKDWDTMIQTLADHLDAAPATISLGVPLVLGGQMIATTLSRSAWPSCVKQYISTPNNVQVIHVKVKGSDGPHARATTVLEHPPAYTTRDTSSATRLSTAIVDPPDTVPQDPRTMHIYVRWLNGKRFPLPFAHNLKVEHLKALVETHEGIPSDSQRLIFGGRQMADDRTLGDYGVAPNSTVTLLLRLRGDKPVIYLYPPNTTEVSVKLSLSCEWSFSAVYPTTRTVRGGEGSEHVKWDVSAQPNGDLECARTGAKVPYLFWEAETNGNVSPTPPAFSPARPSLSSDDTTAVLLHVDAVPAYLDRALGVLGLGSAQRTDFITYWLGPINKHKHIALRFLPQDEYAAAAPLDITPSPDVVTRVFMLFRGVEDHDKWTAAAGRATQPVDYWSRVVGFSDRHTETSLFRVLEWGGMEVK